MHAIFPGGAQAMGFIVPLTKIDAANRLVYGRAAQEVPDRANEIMDYATAKPEFEAWSKSMELASGGLSKGNVRAMHQKDKAVGKLIDIKFNDDEKAIDICAKIVDPVEFEKCLEGVYTGFSVGGAYAGPKWADPTNPALKRYTPRPREMSLVDLPCIPTAGFAELVKMDGGIEQLRLVGRIRTFADLWAEEQAAQAAQPATFAKAWAGRPKTFAEMWGG
jgi:hypothetical protein